MHTAKSITQWGTTYMLVTGASRGLRSALCEGFAKVLPEGSVIVGVARTEKGLEDTKKKVLASNKDIKFSSFVLDLSTSRFEDYKQILKDSIGSCKFDRIILIQNAGSLGQLKFAKDLCDTEHTNKYFSLNVGSPMLLNSAFLSHVLSDHLTNHYSSTTTSNPLSSHQSSSPSSPSIHIINISSLCAISPFNSLSLYCAGKAGRDMAFHVLANETPQIVVLSYSPGPLDNDMQTEIRENCPDTDILAAFTEMKDKGQLVKQESSVEKLLALLRNGGYTSGQHFDFYDPLPTP